MRRKKITRITLETTQVTVIRSNYRLTQAWCELCDQQVNMVSPKEASTRAGVPLSTIYRWVEMDKIHFTEMPEGFLFICLNSLSAKSYRNEGDSHLRK